MEKRKKIAAIITAITGDRVIVGQDELSIHVLKHFNIPEDMVLELIERVLKDPTEIYEEIKTHTYHLFYRLDKDRYLLAVIKKDETGTYFSSIYPTGKMIRGRHKKLKKVKV
jgi:hypothetical protein